MGDLVRSRSRTHFHFPSPFLTHKREKIEKGRKKGEREGGKKKYLSRQSSEYILEKIWEMEMLRTREERRKGKRSLSPPLLLPNRLLSWALSSLICVRGVTVIVVVFGWAAQKRCVMGGMVQ